MNKKARPAPTNEYLLALRHTSQRPYVMSIHRLGEALQLTTETGRPLLLHNIYISQTMKI